MKMGDQGGGGASHKYSSVLDPCGVTSASAMTSASAVTVTATAAAAAAG